MGCDIHLAIERNLKGTWIPVKFLDAYDSTSVTARLGGYHDRSYTLFNILSFNDSRVPREKLNFVWEERGLPENVSDLVRQESDSSDYHTHSYLTLSEIKEVIPTEQVLTVHELAQGITDPWKGELAEFYNWAQHRAKTLLPGVPESQIRFVFWYDN
jgi:hypothetical protein